MKVYKVAVIGGGAAGLVAAGRAKNYPNAAAGNKYLGRKIGITGKGRCNLTTSIASIEDIVHNTRETGAFSTVPFPSF